ncbi:tRNA wybutosine-synthesizing protein 3 [[Emmonsia] crescens]|uniref:tRNA(Phe) 7-[(3-amino-3-carboxypropyl)-4-demethylwyosine(37)-N(4)]-methyltransferase n=1 Tax=[Emmonsia] crescens TaxID=73230 RepID=A0A2B7Z848_9EURO|nr:tRNA wybutosine-synthesizing protein 3 [Emmonsia crescens]
MSAPVLGFEAKKQKILRDLSVPDEEYTDLSPKGSVDAGIRDLIHNINQIPGLVTTSSCAGRISVFLEGGGRGGEGKGAGGNKGASFKEDDHKIMETEKEVGGSLEQRSSQFAPTGGKGSGKWLFVTHEPVEIDVNCEGNSLHKMFNLAPGDEDIGTISPSGSLRLVRFHFEPMILHIMASSLKHAQPVLAAATTAGFRESGIQSLRCIDDTEAYPIVAVRSSGLALESIIGCHQQHLGNESEDNIVKSVVSENYLHMLLAVANERFKANSDRRERFWMKLQELCIGRAGDVSARRAGWEDPEVRRERKREEGLRRSKAAMEAKVAQRELDTSVDIMGEEGELSLLHP